MWCFRVRELQRFQAHKSVPLYGWEFVCTGRIMLVRIEDCGREHMAFQDTEHFTTQIYNTTQHNLYTIIVFSNTLSD